MKKLADEWKEYRTQCITPDAGPVQLEETHRAFFGGALAAVTLLLPETSNDATIGILYSRVLELNMELQEYLHNFKLKYNI